MVYRKKRKKREKKGKKRCSLIHTANIAMDKRAK